MGGAGWEARRGETPEAAARREVLEECGVDYAAPLTPHALIDGYVTYIAEEGEQFEAVLNEENQAYGWFSLDELPSRCTPAWWRCLRPSRLMKWTSPG